MHELAITESVVAAVIERMPDARSRRAPGDRRAVRGGARLRPVLLRPRHGRNDPGRRGAGDRRAARAVVLPRCGVNFEPTGPSRCARAAAPTSRCWPGRSCGSRQFRWDEPCARPAVARRAGWSGCIVAERLHDLAGPPALRLRLLHGHGHGSTGWPTTMPGPWAPRPHTPTTASPRPRAPDSAAARSPPLHGAGRPADRPAGAEGPGQERRAGGAQPGVARPARDPGGQPDELARGRARPRCWSARSRDLAGRAAISVIEGDQETALDADRIRAAGARVGPGQHRCRLPPRRRHGAPGRCASLDPPDGSVVFIENVGNLVCPALFDLGEHARVVLVSVTEGDDKPLKYPHMFRRPTWSCSTRSTCCRTSTSTSATMPPACARSPRTRCSSRSRPPPATACRPGSTGSAAAPPFPTSSPPERNPPEPAARASPVARAASCC